MARLLVTSLIAAVVLVGVAVGAISMTNGDRGAANPVDLHSVSSISFDIEVIASGELEALRQTEIRSELESQATITDLVEEGTLVKKGDLLVQFNTEAIETSIEDELLKVETAKSDLVAAENGYEIQVNENEANLRQAQLKLDLAEIELRKWEEGDLVKKLEDLNLAIEQAERRLAQRKEAYEQSQKLFDRGFLASDQLKNDEINYIDAQANLKTARSNKWVYETFEMEKRRKQLTSDVEEARAELERVRRQNASRLASKEADLTNRKRQLAIREERLAKLREQLEKATVRAPTDGLVVYGSTAERSRRGWGNDGPMQIGQTIRPNELIVVLPDTSQMVASVRVHEANAGRIEPGQRAMIKVDAIRDKVFSAEVMEIGVLAESGGWRDPNLREYTVKLLLDESNGGEELKPSMRCEAEIVIDRVEDSLAVPSQAVFRDGSTTFVYTPEGAKFKRTPVSVGRRSTRFAEITNGVTPGERVLLREPLAGEILRDRRAEPAPETQMAAEEAGPERARSSKKDVESVEARAAAE
jgi:HlyD family secretion protein